MVWWFLLACGGASDDGTASDAPDDSDTALVDTSAPIPTPLAYDFAEAHPWYPCPEGPIAADAVWVPLLEETVQDFGDPSTREVLSTVELPAGSWSQVGLQLQLSCPVGGRCDAWDREASLRLLGGDDADDLELLRYITPYGTGMCAFVDLTDLSDRLTGTQTVESWIDTWVSPGHSDGDGWLVDASLVFLPGQPERTVETVAVWTRQRVVVGDPMRPISDQLPPVQIELPDDVVGVEARVVTTGHGFGFTDNCAEFCKLDNHVTVGTAVVVSDPWRSNCSKNPVRPQAGTWEYRRNGWCPGAVANAKTVDVTDGVSAGTTVDVSLDILQPDGSVYVDGSGADGDPFVDVSVVLLLER